MDRLQLGMIFKEKLLKKYSYDVIFQKMREDLLKLEEGIMVDFPEPKTIKVGVCLYVADNLEAHQMGGFSACFSSKSVCRFCHIQYEDLDDNIHDYDGERAFDKWTVDEYDAIISNLEPVGDGAANEGDHRDLVSVDNLFVPDSDESYEDADTDSEVDITEDAEVIAVAENIDRRGVKSRCPLNTLQSFHCVGGFPPDLLHDLLEGVVAEDLLSIIRSLSIKGWFSIEDYNTCMKRLSWSSYESSDRPMAVPVDSRVSKLKGKAVSMWTHIRNWPFLVKSFVADKADPVLALGLKLHEVTERITATEFRQYEIHLLKEAILDYLDMRKNIRLEFPRTFLRPKPKHHFLSHYSDLIRVYGPPITFWTARFESKHRIAKVKQIHTRLILKANNYFRTLLRLRKT